jgi:hypothetical protein
MSLESPVPAMKIALTLRGAASAASISPHGDSLLLLQDISEVGERTLELPAVDGLGRLAGVLEGDTEVAAASAGALRVIDVGCCVADLCPRSASISPAVIRTVGNSGATASAAMEFEAATYHLVELRGRVLCC